MRFPLLIAVCVLSGCASVAEVATVTPGRFLVTGVATPQEGGVEGSRNKALQMAARHCRKDGKRPEVADITSSDAGDHGATDVVFTCVSRGA